MKANTWAMCSVTPAHLGWFTQFSAVRGNPVLLQSRFGQQGNFEWPCRRATGGGLLFSWRNNDDPNLPWAPVFRFGEFIGSVDAITLIQSNFGSPGNLELIARWVTSYSFCGVILVRPSSGTARGLSCQEPREPRADPEPLRPAGEL